MKNTLDFSRKLNALMCSKFKAHKITPLLLGLGISLMGISQASDHDSLAPFAKKHYRSAMEAIHTDAIKPKHPGYINLAKFLKKIKRLFDRDKNPISDNKISLKHISDHIKKKAPFDESQKQEISVPLSKHGPQPIPKFVLTLDEEKFLQSVTSLVEMTEAKAELLGKLLFDEHGERIFKKRS